MSSIDLDQARLFIELLRGDGDSVVCWQLFNDSGLDNTFPENFHGKLTDVLPRVNQLQNNGFGVFITINPTDGLGRTVDNIISYDWAFADVDGKDIPTDFPLLPGFVSQRDSTHGHVYWPVEGCLTAAQYSRMQKRIAMYLDSDQQVTDVARVARVPGFYHLKDRTNPVKYSVSVNNQLDFNYTIDEIEQAFVLSPSDEAKLENWSQTRNKIDSGTGANDDPVYRQQFVHFLKNLAPVAVEGSGSFTVFKVAAYAYDRGIGYTEAQELMWEHYNPRCEPPWEDKPYDKRMFYSYVKHAWQHSGNAFGCKTATSVFSGHAAPEPTGGWEANAKLNKPKSPRKEDDTPLMGHVEIEGDAAYITPEEAAANRSIITNKMSVVDWAIKFIGEEYPCKTLIRFGKTFYTFNGIHWEEKPDDEIESKINKMFIPWKFAPSKINNIMVTVERMCYEAGLQRGIYLNDRNKESGNCVIMQNGIVEIVNGAAILKPHTRDLFDLNALGYDYNPNANCDEFLKFIDAQWPGDVGIHNQLQELYGLTLINDNRYHLLPVLVGKPRAGKGVHSTIMTKLIGVHNVCNPHLESLIEDHMMNTMSKSKLAIVPEANALHPAIKDRVLNRLKALSAGDGISFDVKYKDSNRCSKWPIIIISCNELPDFLDGSGAYATRVWPFHFTRSFAGVEDRYLADRLCAPDSMAGIFLWALQGLIRVIQTGDVTKAESTLEMIEEIQYDSFILSSFVDEFCILDNSVNVYVDDLYDAYLFHCQVHNQKNTLSPAKFTKVIKGSKHNIIKKREAIASNGDKRRYIFTGISVNTAQIEKHKQVRVFSNVVVPLKQSVK